MAGLVPGTTSAPGHRRHRAARGPVRQAAARRRTIPGEHGPQAHRRGRLVRLAGPSRAHHLQPRRRHPPARRPPPHHARTDPDPRPGPRPRLRGRHRPRSPARPHRGAGSRPAVHRRPGIRGNQRRRRGPRHRAGTPGAAGHPRPWPPSGPHAPWHSRFPDRRLPHRTGQPDRRPAAVRHPDRGTAVRPRRMADRAPPRRPGRPASRPGQPSRTAHDPALIRGALPRCRPAAPRPPERHGTRRPAHHPAIRPGPAHPRHRPSPAPAAAAPGSAPA